MKLIFFFLIITINIYPIKNQLCLADEGCKYVKKKLTYVPLINSVGKENPILESFDFKIIKVFHNCIAIYNSQDNSANLDTSIEVLEMDLARRIPFNKVDLNCGIDENKICFAYQFLELNDKITYKAKAIDAISKLGGEFNKQCMIIPIIDDTIRPISDNLIYICEENKDNLREFFKFRDILSRLIDFYFLSKLNDFSFAGNSISLKEDLLKTVDNYNNMSSLYVKLDSRKIHAYLDPKNFNSKVFEINLMSIDLNFGIHSVLNAIRNNLIPLNWSQNFSPKPIDACCFFIPVKYFENLTYFCIHYDNPNDFSSYECEKKIEMWTSKINNTAKKILIGMNGYAIKHKFKVKTNPEIDCRIPELQIFRERVHNIGLFQDTACDSLKAFTTTYQYKNCITDKTDDINSEISILKNYDSRIEASLDQCLIKGFLDIGKITINNANSASFLVLNENVIPYKIIRKYKKKKL